MPLSHQNLIADMLWLGSFSFRLSDYLSCLPDKETFETKRKPPSSYKR